VFRRYWRCLAMGSLWGVGASVRMPPQRSCSSALRDRHPEAVEDAPPLLGPFQPTSSLPVGALRQKAQRPFLNMPIGKENEMRMVWIGLAACTMWSLMVGCAASIQPMPGVSVGVDASVDRVGGSVNVSLQEASCEFAKAVSWNWGEKKLCPDETEQPPSAPVLAD
jgi:hypothetical protein